MPAHATPAIPKRRPSLAPISFSVGVSFQDGRRAPPIVPTAQPSHAVQSGPERTATFGKSMRDRPHALHQPSSVTLRMTGHQSDDYGRAVGAPVIELSTRSTAFPLFSPARRAREPYLSRFSPPPRWGLPFVPRSRSFRPLLSPSASHWRRPFRGKLGGRCRVPPSRSHARPSASDWSSLIVPAVRIYSSHALGHRATPLSWPRFRLETPLPYGSGVWRRLLSNRPSILGQFDARPPPLHQAKLGTGRVAKH